VAGEPAQDRPILMWYSKDEDPESFRPETSFQVIRKKAFSSATLCWQKSHSFENPYQAAVLTGSRLTLSPRCCNRFTKYRCNWSL